jgi:CubicO group peptidase (beta-lactamase class C family)
VRGAVLWAEGFGFSDLAAETPVTPESRFRIASVSKLITTAALSRLAETGRIDLDAPIEGYVPAWPAGDREITARRLAGHLGGIRDHREGDFTGNRIDDRRYESVNEALSIFRDDSLIAPPGTKFQYTTLGYTLLSAGMEGAAGTDFLTLVRELVLEPLALRATLPNHPDSTIPGAVTQYDRGADGSTVPMPRYAPMYKWAGGGYVSTPSDLVRLAMAVSRPGFLQPLSITLLFTSQRTAGGEETGVGLGWFRASDPWGRTFFFHNGGQRGARSLLLLYPDAGVVVAILSNLTGTPECIEGTGIALAEPFVRVVEGAPLLAADDALAGSYRYRVATGEEEEGGDAALLSDSLGMSGWLSSIPGSTIERLPIPAVSVYDDGVTGAVAAPEGLLPFALQRTDEGLAGTLVYHNGPDPRPLPIRFTRAR